MTISMSDWSKLIVVTSRQHCNGDFLLRIRQLTARQPRAVILREKDLMEQQYEERIVVFIDTETVVCYHNTSAI